MRMIQKTQVFETWFKSIKDRTTRIRIQVRIDRLAGGNPGQHRALTNGVVELKIDVGPGFRIYFVERGDVVIILLSGGEKSTQQKDIARAIALANELKVDNE
jgi:putative addiction module killer protein